MFKFNKIFNLILTVYSSDNYLSTQLKVKNVFKRILLYTAKTNLNREGRII